MHTEFKGLLFIGDPHVSSKGIGRRKDDYLSSVLGKLEACAQLCTERQLYPVILGDLFHKSNDNNLTMLNRLVVALKKFPCAPFVLEGNHDKEQFHLSESDALMLLHATGVAEVVTTAGLAKSILVAGREVHLYAAPYGSAIPDEVPEASDEGVNVLVTHHDLAFGGAYPGALALKPVLNVSMAVNGHMHDTKSPVIAGATVWHNPGNIEPLSVDLAHHVPCAWAWTPEAGPGKLEANELPHGKDLFDLTGLQVQAASADEAVAHLVEQSEFAQLMAESNGTLDAARTDDAAILKEDLELVLASADASSAAQTLLRSLASALAA